MAVLICLHFLASFVQQSSWWSSTHHQASDEARSNMLQLPRSAPITASLVHSNMTQPPWSATVSAPEDMPPKQWAYKFTVRQGRTDYAACSGVYEPASGTDYELNGKPYYVNRQKDRFLAWSSGRWEITALAYLASIQRHHKQHGFYPGSFGGFHAGSPGAMDPDNGTWQEYTVERVAPAGSHADDRILEASPDMAFRLTTRGGLADYAECSGLYLATDGDQNLLNGKPFYINEEKHRLLAFVDSMWEVTSTDYLEELRRSAKDNGGILTSFGGYHRGGGMQAPDDGTWSNYTVTRVKRQHIGCATLYQFSKKPDGENYANCAGTYTKTEGEDGEINGKPYFVSQENGRFLAWTGDTWEVTALQYLHGVQTHHAKHGFWPGTFGGFHAGGGNWPDEGSWQNYNVKAIK